MAQEDMRVTRIGRGNQVLREDARPERRETVESFPKILCYCAGLRAVVPATGTPSLRRRSRA
jgi:hypothetical protein